MLASSGLLSLAGSTAGRSVSLELGRTATTATSLGETATRSLAARASGSVSMSHLYGKSRYPVAGTLLGTYCTGYTLYGTYANGSGGSYNQLIEAYSTSCGWIGGGTTDSSGTSDGALDVSDDTSDDTSGTDDADDSGGSDDSGGGGSDS
jgi:hypothetical protein